MQPTRFGTVRLKEAEVLTAKQAVTTLPRFIAAIARPQLG
jgi:dienelactone hydrolase